MKYEFRWVEPGTMEQKNVNKRTGSRMYSDPTADEAIGKVMKEEKKKAMRKKLGK